MVNKMPSAPLDWHYPRTDLADQILDRLDVGATTALTLFAPRRMGKTEFVVRDLLPMAVDRGYIDVYVNFWDRKDDPAESLIQGLSKAAARLKLTTRIKQTMSRIRGFGFNTPIGGASASLKDTSESDRLNIIQELFDLLMKEDRKVLLALDEVQHLATESQFEPIVYALRGMIDLNRERVSVLYTGSSRSGLQRLFRRRNAPLFSSSQQIDLPNLGSGYLQHTARTFHAASHRTLDINDCSNAFKMVKRVPYDYRQIIDNLILHGGADILSMAAHYLEEHSQEDTYQADWANLKPVDRAVLHFILSGNAGVYTTAGRAFIAEQLGIEDIDVPTVQNAINRLRRATHIAPVGQGRYELEDPYFADWITTSEE